MHNVFYTLIFWTPALIIFPLTLQIQAVTLFCDTQPNSDHLLGIRNKFPGNNNKNTELNNYTKPTSCYSKCETAFRRDG